jgi:hypothetical protein
MASTSCALQMLTLQIFSIPNVGKDRDGMTLLHEEKELKKPTQAIVRLAKCIYRSNRNIMANSWFTSIKVVQVLLKKTLL